MMDYIGFLIDGIIFFGLGWLIYKVDLLEKELEVLITNNNKMKNSGGNKW